MCGIVGFFDGKTAFAAEERPDIARAMTEKIALRGPDHGDVWQDDNVPLVLGHRRLSIQDLSPQGHQPMTSGNGRYMVVYNGEIYNAPEIAADLSKKGISFKGHSDTEILLEAVSEWGLEKALNRFNGMFAFALWDKKEHVLHLIRDPFGQKPLYYGMHNGFFLFASTPKAFKALPAFSGDIDRNCVGLYMQHGYIPAPYCIYKGLYKLPAGSFLSLPLDALAGTEIFSPFEGDIHSHLKPKRYWSVAEQSQKGLEAPFSGTEAEALDRLEYLLGDAVEKCLLSDVPLGAFLSGGIDSSLIVALMAQKATKKVKTFSIGFAEEQFNEADHAKAVADHLGTDHTAHIFSEKDALGLVPNLPDFYDEPFADSSQMPTYLVSGLARQHVTVALSGDAGDELFAGYNRYLFGAKAARMVASYPFFLRYMGASLLTGMSPSSWDSCCAKTHRFLPSKWHMTQIGDRLHKLGRALKSSSEKDVYAGLTSLTDDPSCFVAGADAIPHPLRDDWPTISGALPPNEAFIADMMMQDARYYMADDILAKVDRAAMGVSLETRIPFLDKRVFDFAWSLPLSLKMKNGTLKWPLKALLYRHVPRKIVERPKSGFGVPIDKWLRTDLKEWGGDLLSVDRLEKSGYLNPLSIGDIWQRHMTGKENHHHLLWAALMFESWREKEKA